MNKISLGFVLAAMFTTSFVSADNDTYTTSWEFATIENGSITQYEAMASGDIPMPIGSPWRCAKGAVSIVNGKLVGGFACTNGTAGMGVHAVCYRNKEDVGIGNAAITDNRGGNSVQIIARCFTKKTSKVMNRV